MVLLITGLLLSSYGGLFSFASYQGQSLSLTGETTWIPQYWTGECITRADNKALRSLGTVDKDGEFFVCKSGFFGTYIPLVNGVQCNFYVDDSISHSATVCTPESSSGFINSKGALDSSACTQVQGVAGRFFDSRDQERRYTINAGQSLFVDPALISFSDTTISAELPSYGLRIRSADGFVQPTTTTCEVNTIDGREYHTIDVGSRLEIKPDFPFNAVSGLSPAKSTQIVSLERIENGDSIYISRPGFYFKIKEAEDEFRYVDTTTEFNDASIQCIPRTTGCSDDATIIQIEAQSCDLFGGAITNYAPVQGDNSRLCKYTCESGELQRSSDCITVQTSCPADKPLWDTQTGQCTAVTENTGEPDEEIDYTALVALICGLVILGAIAYVKFGRRTSK